MTAKFQFLSNRFEILKFQTWLVIVKKVNITVTYALISIFRSENVRLAIFVQMQVIQKIVVAKTMFLISLLQLQEM